MMETTNSSCYENPWLDDDRSLGSIRSALLLAERTGHLKQVRWTHSHHTWSPPIRLSTLRPETHDLLNDALRLDNELSATCSLRSVSKVQILAPKLTSHTCALWVCSPPSAIAVTPAISQTSICKALGIDSPSQAQMNKHRHKTWSFCLKYYILSMSSKI